VDQLVEGRRRELQIRHADEFGTKLRNPHVALSRDQRPGKAGIIKPLQPRAMLTLAFGFQQGVTDVLDIGALQPVDAVRNLPEGSNVLAFHMISFRLKAALQSARAFGLSLPPTLSGMSSGAIWPNKRPRSYSQSPLRQSKETPLRTSSRPRANSSDFMIEAVET